MHGMNAGYEQLKRTDCLEAAVRAGRWLASLQEADGSWRRFEHNDIPHTYNTRGTWALVKAGQLSGEKVLVDAAVRNLEWALAQQQENSWFRNNAFTTGAAPFTHTIAYAIRGLVESGLLLQDPRFTDSARRAAAKVAQAQRADGWISGTLDENWQPRASYCCLTGVAQMCIVWSRMRDELGRSEFQANIERGLAMLNGTQRLDDRASEVRGAIAGSLPIWGAYSRFEFPNWAAKFYADALMLQQVRSI
jgi:hypothetical protein